MLFCIVSLVSSVKWDEYIAQISKQGEGLPDFTHPKAMIHKEDVDRAQKNINTYSWAKYKRNSIVSTATTYSNILRTDEKWLTNMIPSTTPGTTTFCPNCVAKGFSWHANGNWEWDFHSPDHLKCKLCGMIYPNEEYPESIKITSVWDPNQTISYIDGPYQTCMYYSICRSSPSGVIRGNKVGFMATNVLRFLRLAYILSGNETFAIMTKKVLLRFAEVIPKYMVYEGYSYAEYADCDPHISAANINNLPSDKIVAPPNDKTDRTLYSGYWSASRLGTSGMDGKIIEALSLAFDQTVNSGVYSVEEKRKVRINVIAEVAFLAYQDVDINNKAVGNRAGVALAGLSIDVPELARFGLEGFTKTIDEWFLSDGGTPESNAYAFMTMTGILSYGYAFRNYSDPENFVPNDGFPKYKNFNANSDTKYDQAWQALIWTSLGNLAYPPLADSYTYTTAGSAAIDFIAFAFLTEENLKLCTEKTNLGKTVTDNAIFYLDPSTLMNSTIGSITLPDVVFPVLSQGYIRTGKFGRDSLVVLDASNSGSHHHLDSLNLVYWKDGNELLNDLGYLWDHVDKWQNVATSVHNTVIIDNSNQVNEKRNGSFNIFSISKKGDVKVMQAYSNAYKQASVYQRTVCQIDNSKNDYLVDIFRVRGGKKREYLFHGPNLKYNILSSTNDLTFDQPEPQEDVRFSLRFRLAYLGYVDVTNVSIKEEWLNQKLGPEFVTKKFTSIAPSGCPTDNDFCFYNGNGKSKWESIQGATSIDSTGIRFTATESSSNNGVINVALMIGNTNGYTAPNAFLGHLNTRYRVSFNMRGTVKPNINCQYWDHGMENNMNNRRNANFVFTKEPSFSKEKWNYYEGYFVIGNLLDEKGGSYTRNKWEIVWNITNDYRLSAHFPKRLNLNDGKGEMVYFQKGWGQRDYRDVDKGAKLPYFFLHRNENHHQSPNAVSTFVAVYEGYAKGQNLIESVDVIDDGDGNVGIKINHKDGNFDRVLTSFKGKEVKQFDLCSNASIAIDISDGNRYIVDGDYFYDTSKGGEIKPNSFARFWSGRTESFENEKNNSYFVISGFDLSNLHGQTFQTFGGDGIERSYMIMHSFSIGNKRSRIYTRYNSIGLRIGGNVDWKIINFVNINDEYVKPSLDEKTKSKSGLIAGVVIGVILFVIVVCVCVFFFLKRRKNENIDGAAFALYCI